MLRSERSWERRAVALVAAVVGAGLLAPSPAGYAADRPDRPGRDGHPTARLDDAGPGLRAAEVRLAATEQTVEAEPFAMVGLTWRGAPRVVRVSTRSDGRWSAWQRLDVLRDGSQESPDQSPVTGTDLAWVGEADAVRVDLSGARPDDLTLVLLDPTGTPSDQAAARLPDPATARARAGRLKPRLGSRASWGADPSWRDGRPSYNRTIQQVHVHHTVNSNDYAPGDVPGLLRGIYRYHTANLGWSDIGYNFLVDRFGRTWVGRAGGAKKAVQGAHTLGFNSTSTGVAVIGSFETTRPGRKVIGALARLAAWKLHRYGRDPAGRVRVWSHGSDRFALGRKVTLPAIDGHRDTNETACPGELLYDRLPAVRRRAAALVAARR
ncbi:N-acetylmuramoyl-L-alanine amidase [Nocardioides rubriscoriae]|uniref:N-acetylmuramoyl-L-alanine amidase n=1 Tax=Nocardioides rubriscoriae TaxID=642762 RepID=UPI001FE84682|nr:N-acetylmuramoyl-L-alanine amidase [Nocardioides rubriscoriae]